jgi:hypothetical protein
MESAGSWNGPEPIRAFPRRLCRLPIPSTRHRDRSQEIAPGAGRLWNCIDIRHSSRRESPGPAGQNHVVAQTNAKASGRALRQIDKERLSFHNFLVLPGIFRKSIQHFPYISILIFRDMLYLIL